MVLLVTQIETCPPEQRISVQLQCADHRPDPPALNQPVPVAHIPFAACSAVAETDRAA